MPKKRGLGRGLDALLSGASLNTQVPVVEATGSVGAVNDKQDLPNIFKATEDIKYLPIEFLQRGRYQPRREFDAHALTGLSNSIKTQGLMQPIVVRPVEQGRYEIIAGERRWRACQMAEMDTVPCLVKVVENEVALAMALVENMQREDLNAIEAATGLYRLQEEFALTHQQVADIVGKSRASVTNLIRLNQLELPVKRFIEKGELEMGHARALLSLSADLQVKTAKTVVAKRLSVRQTEALVKSLLTQKPDVKGGSKREDPNIRRLQEELSEKIGAPVQIQHRTGGAGKLVIQYASLSELEGVLQHIN